MRGSWFLPATIFGGGATALLALVLIAYQYDNQPSIPDMTLAAELGAAIVGALTFTWPFRLLRRWGTASEIGRAVCQGM